MGRVGAGAPAGGQVSSALWVAIGSCHIHAGHGAPQVLPHAPACPVLVPPCSSISSRLSALWCGLGDPWPLQRQDGQTSVLAMGTQPGPAGHCLSPSFQDCTYQLGQRAWVRVSHAGSTMALFPLSTAIQDARFILAMCVREGRHVPGLRTSPTVVSSGHIG